MGKIKQLGLLGKQLGHSFSPSFFSAFFKENQLTDWEYQAFEIERAELLGSFLHSTSAIGLNVTIPYKEDVLAFVDELSPEVADLGATNTLRSLGNGKWKAFNTDIIGFANSLKPFLCSHHERALILGTGGAAKAAEYVLKKLGIEVFHVSRNPAGNNALRYDQLRPELYSHFKLIVNTTPLGMFPNVEQNPLSDFRGIGSEHLLFDLIYNPEKTCFLEEGEKRGATILNGLTMLHEQAMASFKIWQSDNP